jgi:serine/threonine protein kinase
MGDFGLATRRPEKPELVIEETESAEANAIYDDVVNISRLMESSHQTTSMVSQQSTIGESITGGVGTIGYRAPEQEASTSKNATKGAASYNVQVDMYSLGIILFEMFHPPFETVRNIVESSLLMRPSHATLLWHSNSTWNGHKLCQIYEEILMSKQKLQRSVTRPMKISSRKEGCDSQLLLLNRHLRMPRELFCGVWNVTQRNDLLRRNF